MIDSALSEREIADFLCVRSDAVIGERVVGSAYQRAAGQLPDVREAAHAGNHAVVRSDGYLAAQIVGERVRFLRGGSGRLRVVRRARISLR